MSLWVVDPTAGVQYIPTASSQRVARLLGWADQGLFRAWFVPIPTCLICGSGWFKASSIQYFLGRIINVSSNVQIWIVNPLSLNFWTTRDRFMATVVVVVAVVVVVVCVCGRPCGRACVRARARVCVWVCVGVCVCMRARADARVLWTSNKYVRVWNAPSRREEQRMWE